MRSGLLPSVLGRAGAVQRRGRPSSIALVRFLIDQVGEPRADILGVSGERAIKKAARLRNVARGPPLIQPSQALKIEVHQVGGRGLFRAPRLGGDEFRVQRACQSRDDFVPAYRRGRRGLIEPLGLAGFARFPGGCVDAR